MIFFNKNVDGMNACQICLFCGGLAPVAVLLDMFVYVDLETKARRWLLSLCRNGFYLLEVK